MRGARLLGRLEGSIAAARGGRDEHSKIGSAPDGQVFRQNGMSADTCSL
jgi:hypothetical protein